MSSLRTDGLHVRGIEIADVQVAAGSCSSVYGASGSGKTLLLRAIADLDETPGEVWLDEQRRSAMSGPEWRRQVIYLAAESAWWAAQVRAHALNWDAEHLDALGFGTEVLDWDVQRLSSGERQRLALARALARAPHALLLDEPTANLDQDNTRRVEALLAAWRQHSGGCLLWVSHDPAQRARIADKQFEMQDGTLRQANED